MIYFHSAIVFFNYIFYFKLKEKSNEPNGIKLRKNFLITPPIQNNFKSKHSKPRKISNLLPEGNLLMDQFLNKNNSINNLLKNPNIIESINKFPKTNDQIELQSTQKLKIINQIELTLPKNIEVSKESISTQPKKQDKII